MSGSECSCCYQTQKKTGYGQPVGAKTNSDEDLRKRTQDHQNPGFQLISNHNAGNCGDESVFKFVASGGEGGI